MNSLVTVCITTYNRKNNLLIAVRSVLTQTYSNIEIIIVDDCSDDGTPEFVKEEILSIYPNIRYFRHNVNKGLAVARNKAINEAKGKYFIRVDSDDYLNKYSVQVMSEIMDYNKDLALVYSDHFRVDEFGYKQKIVKLDNKKKILSHGAGIMFRTEMIKKVGNYNPNLREAEDHDLLNRMMKKYKSFYLPIPLYRYYIDGKNISLSGNRKNIIKNLKK